MKFRIVQITVDELPSLTGLNASQVLSPSIEFIKSGHCVQWISFISIFKVLSHHRKNRDEIASVRSACNNKGINFSCIYTFPILNYVPFPLRGFFLKKIAKKALLSIGGSGDCIVINARSYHAADLSILIRKMSCSNKIKVSFDMRSLYPEEFALVRGVFGKLMYGFLKQWEMRLLTESDVNFLPLKSGIEKIKAELGVKVEYAPIFGLNPKPHQAISFDNRFQNRYVGYVGSIGAWHSVELLKTIVDKIPFAEPKIASNSTSSFKGLASKSYNSNEMTVFYNSLLTTVVPGSLSSQCFYKTIKSRCNFFSTKASEALSCGVPLIVSSELKELADYVSENKCGLVYDVEGQSFDCTDLHSKEMWEEMTGNALECGAEFRTDSVANLYLKRWGELFTMQGNLVC